MDVNDVISSTSVITLERASHVNLLVSMLATRKVARPPSDGAAVDVQQWPVFYTIAVHQCAHYLFEAAPSNSSGTGAGEASALPQKLSWSQSSVVEQLRGRCSPVRAREGG